MTIPRIVISAPGSGQGKTTVTLAIMSALRRRGLRVAPFKAGPDYIDPQLHRRACGRPSYNLDRYLTGTDGVLRSFARGSRDADIAVIEGAMGLFDGSNPEDDQGSAAEIARILGAPIILVVDASGMASSIGALVRGFSTYQSETRVAAVIANRLGSPRHATWLGPAIRKEGVRDLGFLCRDQEIQIPERNLGLLPSDEQDVVTPLLDHLALLAESSLDLDGVLELARNNIDLSSHDERSLDPVSEPSAPDATASLPSSSGRIGNLARDCSRRRVRIAWASDAVFHFSYQENRDLLEEAGAEIVPFSPLADAQLPDGTDAVWLSGGFPENFAPQLAANHSMIASLRAFAESGGTIYAECGGLMYLAEWFEDRTGLRVPLAGLVPGGTRMTDRLQRFGYAEATLLEDTPLGPKGTILRGHRFHYSTYIPPNPEAENGVYLIRKTVTGEEHQEGFLSGNILATYFHVHLAHRPETARHFVEGAKRDRRK